MILLRGINVGGKNLLPMTDLLRMLQQAGCTGARTYIQSGNAVFSASATDARRIPETMQEKISRRFGFKPAIIMRTREEYARIAAAHPFMVADTDHRFLHVGFLQDRPKSADVARLDPNRSPGDQFLVGDREIFLSTPNGILNSKLTGPYFDSTLGTPSTFRNWRTVVKLAELLATPLDG